MKLRTFLASLSVLSPFLTGSTAFAQMSEAKDVSEILKVFPFNATTQLGATMPISKSRMLARQDGSGWHVADAQIRQAKKFLTDGFDGLRQCGLR